MKKVTVYTDGACSVNPGPGGWAYIVDDDGTRFEACGHEPDTTNNQMELMALIQALSSLDEPCEVDIYSDSKYVLQGLEKWMENWKKNGWRTAAKKPVKNKELWEALDKLKGTHTLNYNWIKGHNGHPENERVDELATSRCHV